MRSLALVMLVACSRDQHDERQTGAGSSARPPSLDGGLRVHVRDKIEGSIRLDGKPHAITGCRPGRDGSLYVDLITAAGTLRWIAYEERRMLWSGAPVECTKIDRTWGGGSRSDGTSYVRGHFAF